MLACGSQTKSEAHSPNWPASPNGSPIGASQAEIDQIRSLNEQARVRMASGFGPVWELDDDGNSGSEPKSTDNFQLPRVDQDCLNQEIRDAIGRHSELVLEATSALRGSWQYAGCSPPGCVPG